MRYQGHQMGQKPVGAGPPGETLRMTTAGLPVRPQCSQARRAEVEIHGAYVASRASTSLGPVTGNAATGVPQARASRITNPKVSVSDGNTNTSPPA